MDSYHLKYNIFWKGKKKTYDPTKNVLLSLVHIIVFPSNSYAKLLSIFFHLLDQKHKDCQIPSPFIRTDSKTTPVLSKNEARNDQKKIHPYPADQRRGRYEIHLEPRNQLKMPHLLLHLSNDFVCYRETGSNDLEAAFAGLQSLS